MAANNIIVNGTFDQGSTGWSGTDIETNHTENAYLNNGSNNAVAEIDGGANQTTVMEQTVTVDEATTTELTFDTALRDSALSRAGSEGFEVEILDSGGNVIASQTVLPTTNSYDSVSVPVDFPSAGDYTIRFTEIGGNNSIGAIVDNVSLLVCFAGGTQIQTPDGTCKVEDLKVGDLVETADGPKPVRWIGRKHLDAAALDKTPKFRPICITAGALGGGLPLDDLRVSRQHRMLVSSPVSRRMFGTPQVLVAAHKLTALPGIFSDNEASEVAYFHILLDEHEILFANGAPSESLFTGPECLRSMTPDARCEILALFPELVDPTHTPEPVLPIPPGRQQTQFVKRLQKNQSHPIFVEA